MEKKPNFILITTDQQRADHLGCYGNSMVKTPAIDKIANRGIVFDNFYVACPICMPNRIAILTGRMPTVNGSRHNGIPLSLDAVTFVDILRAAGYHTGLIGKSHVQNLSNKDVKNPEIFPNNFEGAPPPDALKDAHRTVRDGDKYEAERMPFWKENPNMPDPELPYYGYEHVRFANGHADTVQGHYTAWLAERSNNPEGLRGAKNALPSPDIVAPQAWRTAIPEELYPTTYIAETTIEFIDKHIKERADDPFFIHCSFTDPHHPYTPPGKYFDMYNPDDMELPESFHHRDESEPEMLKQLRAEYENGDRTADGPLPFCVNEHEARQILALSYGMISMVDDGVAKLVKHLEENDLLDNTILIFTSDHGDFMGDHGLMLKHGLHYEGVLRVPFIWSDPKHQHSKRSDMEASSIDIGATILARAGLAPNNGNQGLDIVKPSNNAEKSARSERNGILIEEDELGDHLGRDTGLRTRTFIQSKWRLTIWQGMSDGQLYDRQNDPHELKNLWFDPAYQMKKAEMMEAMLREMIRLGDTSPLAKHLV